MPDIDPHDHGEDAARHFSDYDDFDPRDLPCYILRRLDDAFTLGDAIASNRMVRDYEEEYVAYCVKMEELSDDIAHECGMDDSDAYCVKMEELSDDIAHECGMDDSDAYDMLHKWQYDKLVRLVIFCNKDNGNV